MTTERQLEASCGREAKRRRLLFLKLFPYVAGLPDRVLLAPNGRFLLMELKTSTGRLRPAQAFLHVLWARWGFTVHIVRDRAAFDELCDTLAQI